ncbi:MAG TPA: S46 family peptidase [Ignavibacteriaceae bacterium]|nr:S46 family peptidase [Ignavibacteriaceae bacterium]
MNKNLKASYALIVLFFTLFAFGCSTSSNVIEQSGTSAQGKQWFNPDTVKAGKYDTGTMWTFEFPPLQYFKETYNFTPDQEWLDNTRMSALRFATYCSASFVSEDGLVMTNNHCGRESITNVTKEGENLQDEGFFAATLDQERKVPGLFVDQLVLYRDVTAEVQSAMDKGTTDKEKYQNQQKAINDIEKRVADETKLEVSITPLFNGGKYSLYGYKRYTDVRLVFNPETQLGYFGGDPDNFTYPRYNMDCTFFRVYDENGKPLKTKNYFKWSQGGPKLGEPLFVVGNPGSTSRLNTIAQLEFTRDISYPRTIELLDGLIKIYDKKIAEEPKNEELRNTYLNYTNSYKAISGMLAGLRDPYLMARKMDFEKKFKEAVHNDADLNKKYGDLWSNLESSRGALKEYSNEAFALNYRNPISSSQYFMIAQDVIDIATQLQMPENRRDEEFKGAALDTLVNNIYPSDFDAELQRAVLEKQIERMIKFIPNSDVVKKITGGNTNPTKAVDYMLSTSKISTPEKVKNFLKTSPDQILKTDDPFIYFITNTDARRKELGQKTTEITQREASYNQELGRALFEVYGTSIPPDATFTLRISDGVMKGFPYNGTEAPPVTTFYGLYDRYYSFGKEFPFSLPKRWQNPPAEFDLSTPFNFVSTNDIIGGNSGSPIINKNREIVGLAFDGNIQSLPGNFIFTTEENRCVGVHSEGMVEAIRDLYKATRLSDELINGKIK